MIAIGGKPDISACWYSVLFQPISECPLLARQNVETSKTETTGSNGSPMAAVETLTKIIEAALDYRGEQKPNLTTVAKLASRGSG